MQFAESLANLSMGRSMPKFSLGVQLRVDDERGLTIAGLVEGGAAKRDGLKTGDRLIRAGGESFGDEPLEVLGPFLTSGDPIEFQIERDGELMKVTVRPEARNP